MATTKSTTQTSTDQRQSYDVLAAYQCPQTKHWHQKGEQVSLLPVEACFLKLSGKIALTVVKTTTTKGDA